VRPCGVHGDSAYGTGAARAAYRDAGVHTVIKPKPLRPAAPGGFTLNNFTIDEPGGTVTSPAGHTRPMSRKRTVTFGRLCADCPLRCTTAADGRSMSIHPHEQLLRAARAQARTPEFKRHYPTRSSVERIIAWVATQRGRRVPSSTPASPARRSLGAGLTARAGSGPLIGTRPSPTLELAGRTTTLSTNQV
jgi:Transposase DDE domain